ncbi:hypothetical protein U1Q18_006029, partial [Sarracenia purpurea var. burkii]
KRNHGDCLVDKLNVNEEYTEALRTKSYKDMLTKVKGHQLGRKRTDGLSSSSSSLPLRLHLSDYLEPRQEALTAMIESSNLHDNLLVDYFDASFEACNTCELLLGSVHQARANQLIIGRVIKLSKRSNSRTAAFEELASFARLNNPLLIISPGRFRDIHDSHGLLLRKLTMKFKEVRRRAKFIRCCKKIAGFGLMVSYCAIIIALLVLAVHSMAGIFAAPWLLIPFSLGLVKKRIEWVTREMKTSLLDRVGAELEVAARGVFTLINEFDTMSRLVRRLQDEIEHGKAIAEMCVRNGKSQVLMEVVREFRIHEEGFLEQLEELEEHIYLCFLTINRSRTLVMQEIMVIQRRHVEMKNHP